MNNYAEDEFSTAKLREMMTQAFSDEELITLAFDHFRSTYQKFATGTKPPLKIHFLIEDCYRQGRMDELLDILKQYRPNYQWHESVAQQKVKAKETSVSQERTTISVLLSEINLDELTVQQREGLLLGFKVTLASVLNIPVDEVKIMDMQPGSIILEISLPKRAAERLRSLEDSYLSQELGIQKVFWPEEQIRIWIDEVEDSIAQGDLARAQYSFMQANILSEKAGLDPELMAELRLAAGHLSELDSLYERHKYLVSKLVQLGPRLLDNVRHLEWNLRSRLAEESRFLANRSLELADHARELRVEELAHTADELTYQSRKLVELAKLVDLTTLLARRSQELLVLVRRRPNITEQEEYLDRLRGLGREIENRALQLAESPLVKGDANELVAMARELLAIISW